jgi:hypothetical protein
MGKTEPVLGKCGDLTFQQGEFEELHALLSARRPLELQFLPEVNNGNDTEVGAARTETTA